MTLTRNGVPFQEVVLIIAKCDDIIQKLDLERKLKESPPELEEVLATVRDLTTDAPNMPSTQGGDTSLVQGGEENKTTLEIPTESINQAAPNDSTTDSPEESIKPIPIQIPEAIPEAHLAAPKSPKSTAHIPAASSIKYNLVKIKIKT